MKTLPSDPFLRAYLTSAFWTWDDKAPGGEYESSGRATELFQRLTKASLQRATVDCKAFEEKARELLSQAYEKPGYDYSSAGHDFWLTRNGHGCGFWDRCLGGVGKTLTSMAKNFGECYLIASRGHIYME